MNQFDMKRWQRIRQRGFALFALTTGAPWGIVMLAINLFMARNSPHAASDIVFRIVLWSAMGLLFAFILWVVGESRFHRALAKGKKT